MEKFSLSERYKLELHWDRAIYDNPGICRLDKAYFSGPALSEALKLNDSDYIMLDFFAQYIILVKDVYVAKFSWSGVKYRDNGNISMSNTYITHDTELNRVPKLKDSDYLVIDTKGHDVEDHPYNLVYKTYVVNETTNLYRFGE
jgi:hypothetical protein